MKPEFGDVTLSMNNINSMKNMNNYIKSKDATNVPNGSKKKGTLNSSVNLYTCVKMLHEIVTECLKSKVEVTTENLINYVKTYQLSINGSVDGCSVDSAAFVCGIVDDIINKIGNNVNTELGDDGNTKNNDANIDENVVSDTKRKLDENAECVDGSSVFGSGCTSDFVDVIKNEMQNNVNPEIGDSGNNTKYTSDADIDKNVVSVTKRKLDEDDETVDQPTRSKQKTFDIREKYLRVFNALFVALERENMVISFPREHLRYFLATYTKVATLSNFKSTNKLDDASEIGNDVSAASVSVVASTATTVTSQNNSSNPLKKNKTKTTLSNGSILIEYLKSPSNFQMSLARCDNSDADALRFVINIGFSLPSYIYKPTRINLKHQVTTDKVFETRPNCYKVALNNCKHHIICITRDVLLVWDGTHFTVPPYAVEKELPISAIYGLFNSKDIYVLEVLVGLNKLRAVDILYTNPANESILDQPYLFRLEVIKEKLSENGKWDMTTVEGDNYVNSCLQIPNEMRRNAITCRHLFMKPGQTVAAIGLDRQNVLIAYRRTDGHLEYKTKITNNGPASAFLLNEPMKRITIGKNEVIIKDSFGNTVIIYELPQNLEIFLFQHYVTVEFRENSKLGAHIFDGNVSDVTEFKLPVLKDSNTAKGLNQEKLIERTLHDSRNFHIVMKMLCELPDEKKEELRRHLKTSEKINDIEMNYK